MLKPNTFVRTLPPHPPTKKKIWQIKTFGDVLNNRKSYNPVCLTPERRNVDFVADKNPKKQLLMLMCFQFWGHLVPKHRVPSGYKEFLLHYNICRKLRFELCKQPTEVRKSKQFSVEKKAPNI